MPYEEADLKSMSYDAMTLYAHKTGTPMLTLINNSEKSHEEIAEFLILYLKDNNVDDRMFEIIIRKIYKVVTPPLIIKMARANIEGITMNDLARKLLECEDTKEKLDALYLFSGVLVNAYMAVAKEEIQRLTSLSEELPSIYDNDKDFSRKRVQ